MADKVQEENQALNILHEIQQEIKVPKNVHNDFGGFDYRTVEGILAQLMPLLKEKKAVILLSDELLQIGDDVYIKAMASLIYSNHNQVSVNAYAREEKERSGASVGQLTGAASTYARKYALGGLLGLNDAPDPDSFSTESKPIKVTAPKVLVKKKAVTSTSESALPEEFKKYNFKNILEIGGIKYKVLRGIGENGEYFGLENEATKERYYHKPNNPLVAQLISQYEDEML